MDAARRTAERAAGADRSDPGVRARLITERLRAGTLDRRRVELAAYCGEPAALEVVGEQATLTGPASSSTLWIASQREKGHEITLAAFRRWLHGLTHWDAERAPARSSVTAARTVWARVAVDRVAAGMGARAERAIDAYEKAFVLSPKPDQRLVRKWHKAWQDAGGLTAPRWLPSALDDDLNWIPNERGNYPTTILWAVAATTTHDVVTDVYADLVAWSLA